MLERESTEFIVALILTTTMIALVISVLAVHLVVSGNRLRKAHDLAAAAMKFTPAFMTIVFDRRHRVVEVRVQDNTTESDFNQAWRGKHRDEISFLPEDLARHAGREINFDERNHFIAPLKLPDDGILYLRWEMQNFTDAAGKTEFSLARGYNYTEELVQTQNTLKKISAASSEREERERKRIADHLHDHLGEAIFTSKRLLHDLKKRNPAPEFQRELAELEGAINAFSRGTHSVIYDLVPPALYNVGLAAAIEAYVRPLCIKDRLNIRVEDGLGDFLLNQDLAFFFYKAALELLRNAVKHGGADEIFIALLRTEQTLALSVEDNGSGFVAPLFAPTPNSDSGFGLFSIKNRAEYYGGDLVTETSEILGGGKVTVWVARLQKSGGEENED